MSKENIFKRKPQLTTQKRSLKKVRVTHPMLYPRMSAENNWINDVTKKLINVSNIQMVVLGNGLLFFPDLWEINLYSEILLDF